MAGSIKQIGKSSVIYVVAGVVAKAAKFLLIPIYVRYLTQAEVGVVVYLEAITIVLGRLLSFGLGQSVKRFYVEFEDERDADVFAATIFWVGVVISGLVGVGLGLAAWHWGGAISDGVTPLLLTLAIGAGVLQSNASTPVQRYIVRQEPMHYGAFEILLFVLSAIASIVLVVGFEMGVLGAVLGSVIGLAVFNVAGALAVSIPARFKLSTTRLREAFAYALPALPHLLFTWGITFADRPLLERFVSLAALGVYGVGYQLASVMPVLTNSILNAWIGRFFRTEADAAGAREYGRTLTYAASFVVSVTVGLVVLAPEAVRLVAGSEYDGSVLIMRLVAIGLLFHGMYQALLMVLFHVKQTKWVSVATGTAFVTNIGLNLLLIPRYGIAAAALATVAAYLSATAVTYFASRRHYPLVMEWGRLSRLLILSGTVAAVGWVFPMEVSLGSALAKALLLGAFLAALLGSPAVFSSSERGQLTGLIRRRLFRTPPR